MWDILMYQKHKKLQIFWINIFTPPSYFSDLPTALCLQNWLHSLDRAKLRTSRAQNAALQKLN